ncbi:MAG: thioesterase [Filifactor alocis]|nr:thioesterase [Filifactor alocis]
MGKGKEASVKEYKEEYIIDFRDVDRDYHVKLPQLLEVLGTVSTKHTDALGIDPYYLQRRNMAWVLYDWRVEMEETELYATLVKIRTFAVDRRGMYFIRYFGLYTPEGVRIGRGFSRWVVIDLKNRKITRVPKEILKVFEDGNEGKTQEQLWIMGVSDKDFCPIDHSLKEGQKIFDVRYYDVDANHHVNNVKYVDWAIESLYSEGDFLSEHCVNAASIVYKKEKGPEGRVVAKYLLGKDRSHHEIYSEEGELLTVLDLEWKKK